MNNSRIKILVVDDTIVYRRIVSDVVNSIEEAELVGTAANGRLALDKLETIPVDLVLLDVEMPEMDGLATLDVLRRKHPEIGAIMISSANKHAADITIKALEKGAIDFIPKPEGLNPQENREELRNNLIPLIRQFNTKRALKKVTGSGNVKSNVGTSNHGDSTILTNTEIIKQKVQSVRSGIRPRRIGIIAIGISTGGPNALSIVIPALPENLGVPVLIVQHMPPIFTQSLAEGLDKKSQLTVREAKDHESIQPGKVLIAPGGRHMVVRRHNNNDQSHFFIGINDNPPVNNCRPSVDVLFRSVAAQYGGNILTIIMTGMGKDGCEGVRAIKRKSSVCLTQSEESCVIYGMPKAVDMEGMSDENVPLDKMALRITEIVRNPNS